MNINEQSITKLVKGLPIVILNNSIFKIMGFKKVSGIIEVMRDDGFSFKCYETGKVETFSVGDGTLMLCPRFIQEKEREICKSLSQISDRFDFYLNDDSEFMLEYVEDNININESMKEMLKKIFRNNKNDRLVSASSYDEDNDIRLWWMFGADKLLNDDEIIKFARDIYQDILGSNIHLLQ